MNEKFCILPCCKTHHSQIHLPKVKWHADKVMIERATDKEIEKYELQQLQDYIENGDVPWNG